MSYYLSKHPGLFTYMLLVSVSVVTFLFFSPSASMIGVLSVLWGMYTVMRVLSLYEVSEHFENFSSQKFISKSSNHVTSKLAHDLKHRMSAPENMKRGAFALMCVHARTLVWLGLAFAYAAYQIHTLSPNLDALTIVQNISVFFIIGSAFSAGQSYAYSNRASRLLFTLFALLFALSLYKVQPTLVIPDLSIASHNITLIILAALMSYTAIILVYAVTRGLRNIPFVLVGLSLLCVLSVSYFSLAPNAENTALWIAGWSLFSIFWIRVYSMSQKQYLLYQCE